MNPRLLTLALIESIQGFSVAMYQGLEVIRRGIEREARAQAKSKRFADQVRAEMERIT